MLKRLKNIINNNQIGKLFEKGRIDQNQTSIDFQIIKDMIEYFTTQSKCQQIIAQLLKGIKAKNWVQKLKYHIVVHYFILNSRNEVLIQTYIFKIGHRSQILKKKKFQQIKQWIHNNVIEYYHNYILKLSMNLELYMMCHKITTIKKQNYSDCDVITNSFKALNLIHFIIETQVNFNKLGRYYPQYKIFMDLFKMYLKDVKVYYNFIKLVLQFIFSNYQTFTDQQIKHSFSFLNEAIKTSDKLYQFFYNRYFYYNMKQFPFPTFYKLQNKKYEKLIKFIKKRNINIIIPKINEKKNEPQKLYMNKTLTNLQTEQNNFDNHIHKTYMEFDIDNKYEQKLQFQMDN